MRAFARSKLLQGVFEYITVHCAPFGGSECNATALVIAAESKAPHELIEIVWHFAKPRKDRGLADLARFGVEIECDHGRFSAFCFVAGVWRQLFAGTPPPNPDVPRLPPAVLVVLNLFLALVALAALLGIWLGRRGP